MYHAIVRSKVRKVFAALSAGDTGPMLHTLAPRFHYRFAGEEERHSSSGVIVSSGTGATGWARSLSVSTGHSVSVSPTDPRLAFFVREPESRGGSAYVHDNLVVGSTVTVRGSISAPT